MPLRLFPSPVLLLIAIAAIISLAALTTLWVLQPQAAEAANLSVNDTSDSLVAGDGKCTLREAIINANTDSDTTDGDCAAGSGADVIDLPMGTYTLAITGNVEDAAFTGDLDITDDLTITGAGSDVTIIDGGGIDRVFDVKLGNMLEISAITVQNGNAPFGAGFFNLGTLIITASSVINNDDTAILNHGSLTITGSAVAGNVGSGIRNGSGLLCSPTDCATAEITDSIISGNTGHVPRRGSNTRNSRGRWDCAPVISCHPA